LELSQFIIDSRVGPRLFRFSSCKLDAGTVFEIVIICSAGAKTRKLRGRTNPAPTLNTTSKNILLA